MGFVTRYFDGIVATLFKQRPDGRTAFMPAGVLAKGRLIPDDATEQLLRKKVRIAYMALFAVIIPLSVVLGNVTAFGDLTSPRGALQTIVGAVAIGLLFNAYLFSLARGLVKTDDRLSWSEAYAVQAEKMGSGWVRALLIASIVLTVGGLLMLVFDAGASRWMNAFTVVFFGFCTVVFGKQWRALR